MYAVLYRKALNLSQAQQENVAHLVVSQIGRLSLFAYLLLYSIPGRLSEDSRGKQTAGTVQTGDMLCYRQGLRSNCCTWSQRILIRAAER